ncbi:unnamed protein product [Acanthoscelides obtectus]|uniref:Uncharacterized protein n=1 Tax=Acanthoscelides obtectus TaxID=200917 RepID=A0A9P0MHG4_ACAOB|nr:unnamed protein product [Acanthoscelides obtectus]CAK1649555.1 hypothetical protein AOBTE_LOCUS16307 [Acanthoscelides obtectus]
MGLEDSDEITELTGCKLPTAYLNRFKGAQQHGGSRDLCMRAETLKEASPKRRIISN